jgi:uncharacterized membrane protein YheB (UPF0754 family)
MFEEISLFYLILLMAVMGGLIGVTVNWSTTYFKSKFHQSVGREIQRLQQDSEDEEFEDYESLSKYYSSLETSGWFKKQLTSIDTVSLPDRSISIKECSMLIDLFKTKLDSIKSEPYIITKE